MAEPADASLATPDDLVAVGHVVAAHGVHGWLKVQPHSRQGSALGSARIWWLATAGAQAGGSPHAVRVLVCRPSGSHLLAQLEGVADRDQAQALRGLAIWVSRASFPAPAEDEYYWVDLIGCFLYGEADGSPVLLGQVDEIFDNGAHAVLQVVLGTLTDSGDFQVRLDPRGRPRHGLVPFVAAHVQRVDLQARRIDSDWPAEF
jgi:16S rRNA processing protein RimM